MKTLADLFRRLTPGVKLTVEGPYVSHPGLRVVHECTRFRLTVITPDGSKRHAQWPRKKDIDLYPDGWNVKEDGRVMLRYRFLPPMPEETLAY